MSSNLRALLVAPAPMFIGLSWVLRRSEFGWWDALISISIAFAASYGSMVMVCYPIHRLLRQLGLQNLLELLISNLFALAVIIAVLTFTEPMFFRLPENEPSLKDGLWLVIFILEGFVLNFSCVLYWILKEEWKPNSNSLISILKEMWK